MLCHHQYDDAQSRMTKRGCDTQDVDEISLPT